MQTLYQGLLPMDTFSKLLFASLLGFLIWYLAQNLRGKSASFSSQNLQKSAWVMGCLALFLIITIAIAVSQLGSRP
jgi:hypothetical protein